MKQILITSLSIFLITSCINSSDPEKEQDSTNHSVKMNDCELYGHVNRIDGVTGATKLIKEPSNRIEKIIFDIFNLSELNEIQLKLSEKGSHDFVAISVCDITSNPFSAQCIVDNYYLDSIIFNLEIDTIKMEYQKID